MTIGKRLKEERERLKLSQENFGAIGNAGRTTVTAWERGTAFPNANFLRTASEIGVDVLYVLTGMRDTNIAATPIELAYLRNCRELPNNEAREAVLNMLTSLRKAYDKSTKPEG